MVVAGVVKEGNADSNSYPLPPTDERVYNGAALILIGILIDLGRIPLFITGITFSGRFSINCKIGKYNCKIQLLCGRGYT
jgi:hypothetical protein